MDLYPHQHEFDGPVLLLAAKNGQPFFPGFDRGFVDPVKLQELTAELLDQLIGFLIHSQGSLPMFTSMVYSQVCLHAILAAWLAWDAGCLGWSKNRANWHAF